MKQLLAITFTILFASISFAAEPKAALCREQAIKAAEALFALNNKTTEMKSETELVDMDHAEVGGYEVWDVIIESKGVKHSAYRMTALIEACTVIDFEIPLAN